MPAADQLESIVQRVVDQVLQSRLAEIREEVARRVAEQLSWASLPSEGAGVSHVAAAIAAVQAAATQADILTALVAGATRFGGRIALFVIRSGSALGWQGHGVDEQVLKALHLGIEHGTLGRVMRDRVVVRGPARDLDGGFISALGIAANQHSVCLPLIVKDKVAAILYADAGPDNKAFLDAPALELLVRSTGLWLEVITVRKAGPSAAGPAVAEHSAAEAMITSTEKVGESASALTAAPAAIPVAAAPPPPASRTKPAPTSKAAPPAAETMLSPQDQEVHNKARRFAKLLVDEIKLYNQAKVQEGRKNKDLYDRLKDDIDKSRATYDKRYGSSIAADGNYFSKEVVRILADDDSSLLGSNFPG